MTDNNEVFDQVFACIFSGHEYKEGSSVVLNNIASNSKQYIDNALVSIYEVLVSPDCPPISHFYALFLLVRATETKNKVLIAQLAACQDLLNKLFQDAQCDKEKPVAERGTNFFS